MIASGHARKASPSPDDDRLLAQQCYLRAARATKRYPGIQTGVAVDRSVTVALRAPRPVDLPLVLPGWSAAPVVGASSTAAATVLDWSSGTPG